MATILMGFWDENGRKRLAALASARARDDFEPVAPQNPTFGAADLSHLFRLDARKSGDFLRTKAKNLSFKSVSRQNAAIYEYTS